MTFNLQDIADWKEVRRRVLLVPTIVPTDTSASALQSAFREAKAAGGVLLLGIGRYRISSQLLIDSPMTIRGCGWASILEVDPSVSRFLPILVAHTGSRHEVRGVVLENFQLDGMRAGELDTGLITINNAVGFIVRNLYVHSGGTIGEASPKGVSGISVSAGGVGGVGSEGTIEYCLTEACTKAGINWTTEAINGRLIGNVSRRNAGNGSTPGIQVNGGWNGQVIGGACYENEGAGLLIGSSGTQPATDPRNLLVSHVHSYKNGQGAAPASGAGFALVNQFPTRYGHVTFDQCVAYENGVRFADNGFLIQNQNAVELVGCHAHANKLSGALLDGVRGAKVTGGFYQNNNQLNTGTDPSGIMLRNVSEFEIVGAACNDTQEKRTQGHGLLFLSGTIDKGLISSCRFGPNASTPIAFTVIPTRTHFDSNVDESGLVNAVSADRGDASVTIHPGVDAAVQRYATALTANRRMTLGTTNVYRGAKFRVVRTGLGAFTLDVGGLKTIAAGTAAWVDVEHDGAAWILTGYGTL